MKLVIDTNVLISALLKKGDTRRLLFYSSHVFLSPDYLQSEVEQKFDMLQERSGLSRRDLRILLNLLLAEVDIAPIEEYRDQLDNAMDLLGETDVKDVPFLALAMAKNARIWSNDRDFLQQEQVTVLSTKDVIEHTPEEDIIGKK